MSDTVKPAPKPGSFSKSLAAVLITLLLVVGIPAGYVAVAWSHAAITAPARITDAMARAAAEAIQPKIDIHQIVVNSVSDLHKESKLVVFSAQINADVTQEETYSRFGLYMGSNVARVIARDAQVQYVIDLNNIQTSDFIYNDQAKVLSLFLPKPKLDTQMVSIDPAKIQTVDLRGGWARFDKQETRDHAVAELKPNVLSHATAPYIRQLAESGGIDTTTKFLQPLADTLAKDGVTVHISYRE